MRWLHHLALGAHDVERVATFYRDQLGLRENKRHHYPDGTLRSIWLDLGSHAVLMIEHTTQPPRHVDGIAPGPFLLAVTVTPDEHAALATQLENAGHPIESRTDFTSYTRDPEGNRVAISHYPFEKSPPVLSPKTTAKPLKTLPVPSE